MGGAIACGLAASGGFGAGEIVCSDCMAARAEMLHEKYDIISASTDNRAAAAGADVVVVAVKPWYAQSVIGELGPSFDPARQMLVSVVAGLGAEEIAGWLGCTPAIFCVIPNTAVSIGKGMTFIAPFNADEAQVASVRELFGLLGGAMVVDSKMLTTGMILASCGIAFALRYLRASAEGGVELGCTPQQATEIAARTMIGAAELLLHNGSHPEQEIDRVTTAGGITIRGLNEMEHAGFTSAVIRGLKACR